MEIIQSKPCNPAIIESMKQIETDFNWSSFDGLLKSLFARIDWVVSWKSHWSTLNLAHLEERLKKIKAQMDIIMALQAKKEEQDKIEMAALQASVKPLKIPEPATLGCHMPRLAGASFDSFQNGEV